MFFFPFVLFFLLVLYSSYPPVCDACFCTCIFISTTKCTYNELYNYNCLACVCENMGFVEVISACWRNSVAAVSSGGHWMASQLQVWQWKCGNVRITSQLIPDSTGNPIWYWFKGIKYSDWWGMFPSENMQHKKSPSAHSLIHQTNNNE